MRVAALKAASGIARMGIVRAADREIPLRPKSFEVLRYLVENADRLVTKAELIKAVWPNVIVTDDALMHCVSEARQAIADSGQTLIATVPRRGYRFMAPVLRVGANAAAAAPAPLGREESRQDESPDRPSVAVL